MPEKPRNLFSFDSCFMFSNFSRTDRELIGRIFKMVRHLSNHFEDADYGTTLTDAGVGIGMKRGSIGEHNLGEFRFFS